MALRIHLQDSQGSGCKIDARNAVLSVSEGIFQIGQGNHLSFPSGKLEITRPDGSRFFGFGEGFASIEDSQLSLVTDRYTEFHSQNDIQYLGSTDSVMACAVCGKKIADTSHCITLNGKLINLCCPHCSDTFQRAATIVRSIYDEPQDETSEK